MPRQHSLPHGKASTVDDASRCSSTIASGGVESKTTLLFYNRLLLFNYSKAKAGSRLSYPFSIITTVNKKIVSNIVGKVFLHIRLYVVQIYDIYLKSPNKVNAAQ